MKQAIAIIISFSIGLLGVMLFFDGCGRKPPERLVITPVVALEKKASDIEQKYSEQIRVLTHENDSLRHEIDIRRRDLIKTRQVLIALESKTKQIQIKIRTVRDTVMKVVYCDSLQTEVDSLVTEMNHRDSVCQEETAALNSLIKNKDSTITISQKSYSDLKSIMENSFDQQKALSDQLSEAGKQLKRKTLGSRILAAGVLILSGITAASFIHR
jgi:chromosome segregation ATPase